MPRRKCIPQMINCKLCIHEDVCKFNKEKSLYCAYYTPTVIQITHKEKVNTWVSIGVLIIFVFCAGFLGLIFAEIIK